MIPCFSSLSVADYDLAPTSGYEIDLIYSEGVIPSCFLKDLINVDLELKPESKAILCCCISIGRILIRSTTDFWSERRN